MSTFPFEPRFTAHEVAHFAYYEDAREVNEDYFANYAEALAALEAEIEIESREDPQGSVNLVIKHVPTGRYFECSYWYDSWSGSEYNDDMVEVEPYQEIVTKYRRVQN